ncbi:ATP-binding cassette domain-containing protein [Vannielia sp.]|uniref:amino acid ABC transporter ATP-binding/permease protein n=1 Tax=Vannielia sp. TaxID=2813045 RepID=UPI002634724A|nr:ATP-binding cassette domain-containing protein [Vannielia sp.]
MMALWRIFRMVLREQPVALLRGALLGFVVLVMGAALLGLSGWFITASAAAGLAGVGATFDFFRPSAMVRFLALGRATARYGERILTHDATLRALEVLRLRLLGGLMAAPYPRMVRIRGAQALNRLTADIDALDGVPLRLFLPLLAGLAAQLVAFVVIWALVGLPVALWILLGYLIGAALIFWQTTRKTARLSRRTEAAAQAFRSRMIDLIRARRDLAVQGGLAAQAESTLNADDRRFEQWQQHDRAERLAGASLAFLGTLVAGGALWLGITLVQAGQLAAPFAGLAVFATLALAETIAPLRRAASDLGRMAEAARRVVRDTARPAPASSTATPTAGALQITDVTLHRPLSHLPLVEGFSLTIAPSETVALTGPSGSGKSTLLLAAAALHPVEAGQIALGGVSVADWPETALRDSVALLPQRSVLMAGTVAEALSLAAPSAPDSALWKVMEAVQMAQTLRARNGLQTPIGARGDGLSGGEARRLVLARVLLRNPKVLLLDEPTEGLDAATAKAVLSGARRLLPEAAILIAAHRSVEADFADRKISLA